MGRIQLLPPVFAAPFSTMVDDSQGYS